MLSLKHHMTVVMLEKFGGAQLVQQEPDASSFPNGELEILLKQRIHRLGSYISSVHLEQHYVSNCFISYTGEALDYKTPLLRAYR
jgi:glutamine synthetase